MKYNLKKSLRLKKKRNSLKRSKKSFYSKNKRKNRNRKSLSKKRLRGGSPAYRFHGESGMLSASNTSGNFKPLTYVEKDNVSNLISVSM